MANTNYENYETITRDKVDIENPDEIHISTARRFSSSSSIHVPRGSTHGTGKLKSRKIDELRKNSDSRLIGNMDLNMAMAINKKISEKKCREEAKQDFDVNVPVMKEETTVIHDNEIEIDEHHEEFEVSSGLTSNEAERLLRIHGRNEFPEKVVPKWCIFISQLWQPMPVMIWAASIIEAGISNYIDMMILLLIQFANATIGFYEISRAGDAVAALKKSLKALATVKRNGKWQEIEAALLVPGDLVLLASGKAVPADCRVNHGQIDVDQAALTGESLPVTMYAKDSCKMGSTVVRGEAEGTVEFTGVNTFFGKTAALLQQTNEVSHLQQTLISIILVLVVMSLTCCTIVLVYLSFQTNFEDALSFAVVLMVASIPLAIEIVTTTTLALGSKELVKEGAIVAQLAAIEDMAGMAILCSDKTGTLTLNKMVIQDETPIFQENESQYSLLRYAAMAARWKEPPKDALDTLTLNAVDMTSLDSVEQIDYIPFDPVIKRTEGTLKDLKTGKTFKTTKGAPHVILKLVNSVNPDDDITQKCEECVHSLGLRGIRSLAVAKTDENGLWNLLGLLTFLDPPRPDTKKTIEDARKYGVAVKMITGDHALIAKETARVLNLGDYIIASDELPLLNPETKQKPDNLSRDYGDMCLAADGFAQVFPEQKFLIVECLRELGYKVGMTGDGVNDAPALKRADVGVAVFGATDAARAAADIVLTQEGLSTIVNGILISRRIFARIRNFLTYRIAATMQLLIFFFIAVFWFKPIDFQPSNYQSLPDFPDDQDWPKFFHMPVLMLQLITLLNDGTLIAIGYDNVVALNTPEVWNRRALFAVSSVLAGVALISSLLLLALMLSSWQEHSFFQTSGLGGLSYGQITTAIYLKVSISDFLTLFSARTGFDFFWSRSPSPILLGAGAVALTLSTVLACSWPASYPDKIYALGLGLRKPYALAFYIWIYCIVWWWIQDFCKVIFGYFMVKHNWFGINDTGKLELPGSTLTYIKENKEKHLAHITMPTANH